MRRITVEEAFITPAILDGWKAVLNGKNVEPGFAAMGKCLLGPTGKPLFDRLLDLGAARVAHKDSEHFVGGCGILHRDLEQGAHGRIHGRVPQFLGIHFAEPLETSDLHPPLTEVSQLRE